MRLLQLAVILLCAAALAVAADNKNETRTKRQHVPGGHPRRSGHRSPPPYAVQMEPIAHYSQRDPLYIPHADSKSDNFVVGPGSYYPDDSYPQHTHYHPSSSGSSGHGSFYHQGVTEPEPIIEIIIKESNETLPTPVPPTPPPTKKPKKEPIQVFYVKYEKKQEYGEDKPRVVYDKPVPALTPVEEHEDHHEEDSPSYPPAEETEQQYVTEPPPPGPSTTLRTVIHPDSEYYHSGSSGIRVTFGSEQVPPNNHHKRSDKDAPASDDLVKPTLGLTKRQHGPFSPIDPPPPPPRSPAFGQQRIVNSFNGPQQLIGSPPPPVQQSSPPNFNLQPQFHQQGPPPHIRNQFPPNHQRPRERPSITIQGLPEIQQRQPFNSFVPPHRLNVNHPQQGPTPPFSHQNVQNFPQGQQLPNSSPANFNFDPQLHYKQQREQEKQRFFEQQRYQERRQQEQKRLQEQQRIQDQQRQQEQFRILEQQRRKQEHEQQKHRTKQQQNQYQPQHQQQQFPPQQQQQQQTPFKFSQPEPQPQPPQLQQQLPIQKPTGGEILKAIPKLEQHYAIRENPLHPGPFPPNPQYTEVSQSSYAQLTVNNQYPNQNQQGPNQKYNQNKQYPQQQQQPSFQNQQQFFLQNLPPPQQQRPAPTEAAPSQQPSIWGRPVFQGKNPNGDQKIYATPATKTENDYKKYFASTPNSIRYAPTSPRPSTTIAPRTTTATTPLTTTTTTPSPRNEAKIKANIASLPDEVPDDIREQLLSSGILGNADIQILDYDKVGGINIGDLPPEALANFYGAGGAAATGAASEPVPQIARAKRPKVTDSDEVQVAASSSSSASSYNSLIRGGAEDGDVRSESVNIRPGAVEMKVVRFDPNTAQGQAVADRLIYENATRLSPVALVENGQPNNGQYNRYLPLKVSGASFPIPDVPELAGKKITSVVVLAPVDYGHHNKQQQQEEEDEEGQLVSHRQNRKIGNDVQAIRFLAGDSLKMLVKKPSVDNYKRWLEQERQTEPQRQSVVLLVTTPYNAIQSESDTEDKEIFMYDVASESVSKLAGDLSTAFVDAAESNSDLEDPMGDPTATTQH